jgi:hypothetical protein
MKSKRLLFALLAVLCFAGWRSLYTPPSPTQDLPPVHYSAFKPREALAGAARSWGGITAATYNAQSDLLVLAHHRSIDPVVLKQRLEVLRGETVALQDWSALPAGGGCPVPHEYLALLPNVLLALGAVCTAIVLFAFRQKTAAPAFSA